MSIIIRLQNLPLEANSLDIRRFFHGLQIPDGGVHIVGGENGDAFIAFASDEDARQAMERNGHMVKDCRIKLLLSSRNEMQKVIDLARNQTIGIKPIDTINNVSNSGNYLNPGLMSHPNVLPNNINLNINNSRSPDRRAMGSRNNEREGRIRNRSRSRSPIRQDRDRSVNGSAGNGLNRMGSMHSGIMNAIRESTVNNTFQPPLDSSLHSRLSYSEAIPSTGLQDQRLDQWNPNDGFNGQRGMRQDLSASGDFDRDLNLRDNRLVRDQRDMNLNDRAYTVELRNLPYNVVVRDIVDFFNGLFVPEENIKILIDDRGFTTGGALIRFNNERDFDAALSMNKRFLGNNQIDVQPLIDSFVPENNDVIIFPPQSSDINVNASGRQSGGHDLVMFMKGLPYSNCNDRDVRLFFEPIRLADVVIETDPKGKPTGNAFVEFENIRDYEAGLQRNMKHMGRRYIELLPTNKDDMLDARRVSAPPSNNDTQTTFCINITGLPATVTNRDLTNYFASAGAQPYAIHIMLRPNGLNAGEAYVEFGSLETQYVAVGRDGDFIGNSRIHVKSVPFERMREVVGNPPPFQSNEAPNGGSAPPPTQSRGGRGGRHEDRFRPQHRREREARKSRGNPFSDVRCVIVASNMPYRASTEDVCVFFSDFGITEECVRRQFNDKGQPAAEATIAFHTPEDATRAVRQMHKKFLIGRPLFLRHA